MTQQIAFKAFFTFPRLEQAGRRSQVVSEAVRACICPALAVLVLGTVHSSLTRTAYAADALAAENWEKTGPARTDWSGAYAGAEAGIGQTATDVTSAGAKQTLDRFDATFGVFAGYNWQVSNVVLSVEASGARLGGEAKSTHPVLGQVRASSRWSGTLKGRIGYDFNRFMPYLSAGIAVSDHTLKANGQTENSVNFGPVLGAGVEVALRDNWRVRADYTLSGITDSTDWYGGMEAKRTAANHRLMLGISHGF
jgi:opacity protein-like surface antigen